MINAEKFVLMNNNKPHINHNIEHNNKGYLFKSNSNNNFNKLIDKPIIYK